MSTLNCTCVWEDCNQVVPAGPESFSGCENVDHGSACEVQCSKKAVY